MIDAAKIKAMVNHWLETPPNGYFTQSYGADVRSMLLRELSSDNADALLDKLRRDIPLMAQLDSNQLSIDSETDGFDKVYVYLFIGNIAINLGETKTQTSDQDYYDVRAK
jgi:hypothetical protein